MWIGGLSTRSNQYQSGFQTLAAVANGFPDLAPPWRQTNFQACASGLQIIQARFASNRMVSGQTARFLPFVVYRFGRFDDSLPNLRARLQGWLDFSLGAGFSFGSSCKVESGLGTGSFSSADA